MDFKEFKRKLMWDRVFDKYFFSAFAIGMICFSLYMIFFKEYSQEKFSVIVTGCSFFLVMGIYTLKVAVNIDRFTIVENNFTEYENTVAIRNTVVSFSNALMQNNYAIYVHRKKNFFKTPYKIYLYADNNFIAINVMIDYGKGVVDFGKSARLKSEIIKIFKEQCNPLINKV